MKLLAAVALHGAGLAQALVKVDWAITAYDGATLGDCVYSLLHEHDLGAQWIHSWSPKEVVAVCYNPYALGQCRRSFFDWDFIRCVQRYDVYYHDDNALKRKNMFTNSHGNCYYHPFSNNAGGEVHDNYCRCSDVGQHETC